MSEKKIKKEMNNEQPKVGVYICYCGGNISDHVDVEAVRAKVANLPGVTAARTNMFMCSDPGQEMIMEDLQSGVVNRVVVASCAPSLHETTFRNTLIRAGMNPYIYDHANIREHVSWVHHGQSATDKATRLISAAAAKAEQLVPLEPIRVDAKPHATVIGGGIAGLRAAKDLAERGINVALIEKSPFLGGQLARLDRVAPTGEKAHDLVEELVGQVLADPAISVHTCSTVAKFEGYVGSFKLGLKHQPPPPIEADVGPAPSALDNFEPGAYVSFSGIYPSSVPTAVEELTIETGVIILATGFKTYRPRRGEYGYKEFEQVITLPELIRSLATAKKEGDRLVVNGREIRSVAMIHCVGSRQIPGIHPEDESGRLNEYCSRTCCSATLNAANTIREAYPGTSVYEFYRDIRTYGRGQEELYSQASRNRVVFLRFEADESPQVFDNSASSDFPLRVKAKDTLTLGEEVEVPADLVVLATGMEPTGISELVEMMKLPVGVDRFLLEVHPKLRPVELPQAGILLAGTCQAPMDVGEACNAAGGAAVKAAALLDRGYVELDPFVAEVDFEKCKGSGACIEACLADGALQLVQMEVDGRQVRRAQVTPALCLGCGACVAVCPENAIDVNGWTLKQYEAMVDRIVANDVAA
ncbi:MAG: CoB--CoM heterodisulfide reductase iron-sulfur subunit A family protein [Desulfobacterales bacterium]